MEELGFTSLASDTGVFYYRGEGSFVVTIIYVDDTIFCRPSKSLVLKLKEVFMKRWETQDLGEVTEFLCAAVMQNAECQVCCYSSPSWICPETLRRAGKSRETK